MRKLLLFCLYLIFTLTLSSTHKPPHFCDHHGHYRCRETETCCQVAHGLSKYGCFEAINGVCCSDGKHICPQGTICNNIEGRCEHKGLFFLEDSEYLRPILSTYESVSVLEVEQILSGLVEGLEIFNNLPNKDTCRPTAEMTQDLVDIIAAIKGFDWSSGNYIQLISLLTLRTIDYVNRAKQLEGPCRSLEKELNEVFDDVKQYLSDPKYGQRFVMHTLFYINTFKKQISDVEKDYLDQNYKQVGLDLGGLIHDFLLFDFGKKLWNIDMIEEETNKKSDLAGIRTKGSAVDFIKCFRCCEKDIPVGIKDIEFIVHILAKGDYKDAVVKIGEVLLLIEDISANCASLFANVNESK